MNRFRHFAALFSFFVMSCGAAPAAPILYRIIGTAVSTRDSAPVPYCRMQVTEASVAPMSEEPRPGADLSRRLRRQEPLAIDADTRGHFEITLDRRGRYVLTGSARNFRRQGFDTHEGFTSSIVLTPATPTVNIVFRMERDASIIGLVLDEAGEPVRNAQVFAESVGQSSTQSGQRAGRITRPGAGMIQALGGGFQAGFAQTDDRGRYELSSLTPGAYRVRVQAQPWYAQGVSTRFALRTGTAPSLDPSLDLVYATLWFPGVEEEQAAEPILLTGGEEFQADFQLTPKPSVHLVVPRADPGMNADGQPRPQRGVLITRISPAGGGFGQNSTTNGSTQEFTGLSTGLYEIRGVGMDGRPDAEAKQIRILPNSSGVVDVSTAEVLTKVTLILDGVDAGQAGQITFVDQASGRRISTDGGSSGFAGRRRADADTVEREHAVYLAQGKWEVHLPSFGTTYLISMQATGASAAGATLKVGEHPVMLTLHMGTGRGEVSGVAVLDSKPVQGAMILLVPATLGEPGSVADVQRDQTNTDGSFSLRGVVPGRYILLAIDHGWGVSWRDPATLAGYLARGVPVEVAPKAKVKRDLTALVP